MDEELEKVATDPKIYEIGFHVVSTVAEDELGARVTAVRDAIEAAGGRVIADGYPKYLDLAYPMVKMSANKRSVHHSAYFGWIKFESPASSAKRLNEMLAKDDFILRYILVKTVREDTMAPKKVFLKKRQGTEGQAPAKVEEKPALSEEELDKTIEGLVIS